MSRESKALEVQDPMGLSDYATVKEVARCYPSFSQHSLRNLITKRKTNGFDRCIHRVGRKILISYSKFAQWLAEKAER